MPLEGDAFAREWHAAWRRGEDAPAHQAALVDLLAAHALPRPPAA